MLIWEWGPNWAKSVEDRLEYKTDVIVARDQSEQRRSLRSKPRRTLVWSAQVAWAQAAKMRRELMTSHLTPWMVPYWPWSMRVMELVVQGNRSVRVAGELPASAVPGTYFAVIDTDRGSWGGKIMRVDAADGGITVTLDTPAPHNIRPGTVGYPAWVARIQTSLTSTAQASFVEEMSVEATQQVDGGSKVVEGHGDADEMVIAYSGITVEGVTLTIYKEVMIRRFNWRDGVNIEHTWASAELDSGIGIPTYYALGKNGRLARGMPIMMKSRDEAQWWYAFIHRQMGRMRSFYVGTGLDDFTFADVQPTDGSIRVEGTHVLNDVNTHIAFRLKDGTLSLRQIKSIEASGADSLITLVVPWAELYPVTQVRSACYAGLYRLTGDSISVVWKNDQVSEMTLTLTSLGATSELQ